MEENQEQLRGKQIAWHKEVKEQVFGAEEHITADSSHLFHPLLLAYKALLQSGNRWVLDCVQTQEPDGPNIPFCQLVLIFQQTAKRILDACKKCSLRVLIYVGFKNINLMPTCTNIAR